MTDEVECQTCHKPVRSRAARARRIGSRCWRKLRPDQRAAITKLARRGRPLGPSETRAALNRAVPPGRGQTALPTDSSTAEETTHA
ncbi:hypothetical protein AB0D33_01450 [Streptomyces sp. NPDC048404]|uniref:hypothetical protein n=1 Tax=unclassified Streptomyces TaxID=2593676 RepID=UPI00342B8BF9